MAPMVEQTSTFRIKVERALFDEEGHSRIRMMEVQNETIERAVFDEEGRNRIAKIEEHTSHILKIIDRGNFLTWFLWTGFIGIGGVLGWAMDHFWLKR